MEKDLLELIRLQQEMIKLLKEREQALQDVIELLKLQMNLEEKLFLTPSLN